MKRKPEKITRAQMLELRKLKVHPKTVGPYRPVPAPGSKTGIAFVRSFGPGSVLQTRSGAAYHVQASGAFKKLT